MRRFFFTLFALSASLGLLAAAGAEDEIRQVEKTWAAAVASGDHAAVAKMLGEGLIYAHSTGVVENKSEYLGKLKSGAQKYDGIEHQSMTIRTYGDSAVVHAHVRMHGKTKGEPFDNRLMMLHTWIKQGGRWLLAAHQTTRLQ